MKRTFQYRGEGNRLTRGAVAEAHKRAKMADYNPYAGLPRGFNQRNAIQPYRLYTPRTPGGQIVSERKYLDYRASALAVAATNSAFTSAMADPNMPSPPGCLFAPSQGNDISNREGRNVYVHTIRITGVIDVPGQSLQNSTDIPQTVRLILVMDKQTNGAQMTSDALIQSTGDVPGTFQFQNTANFGRFQILKDKVYTCQPFPIAANGAGSLYQSGMSRYFKLKYTFKTPIKVNFNATNGGTVADIVDNSFHLLAGKYNNDSSTFLNYQVRVSFTG